MINFLASLILTVFLAGCAWQDQYRPVTREVGQAPPLCTEREATPGSSMFSQWDMLTEKYASIDSAVRTVSRKGIVHQERIENLLYYKITQRTTDEYGPAAEDYCYDTGHNQITLHCFLSIDGKTFSKQYIDGSFLPPCDIDPPVFFKKGEFIRPGDNYSFGKYTPVVYKRELMLSSVENKCLTFIYKEYTVTRIDSKERSNPTSVQEVRHKFETLPTVVASGKFQMEIIKIQAGTVTYRVLSPFDFRNGTLFKESYFSNAPTRPNEN